jgi:protease-4
VIPSLLDLPLGRPRIAVLEIAGQIGVQVRGPEMVRTIKALREDARVAAVVVEVDSPGGSAPVADAIFRALQRLSAKKPTVAYIGTAGLSGGYLIACGAQHLMALPTSLVGSIGVIFTRPVVEELMQKVGVRMVVTHEGRLKAMFQPWQSPSPEETQKVQALTEEYYNWFVDAVAKARGIDASKVREYATGEMYSAARGKEIGLVDELGDFEAAVERAKELAKVPERPRLQWVRPRRPLLERLMARGSAAMAGAVAAEIESRISPRIDFR